MPKKIVEIDADLQELIPQFLENRKKDIASLVDLANKKDLPSIAQLAHKVKGAAAGYGFVELSDIAAQMEKLAKNGESGPLTKLAKDMDDHFNNIEVSFVQM
jgi:HPt (histidine-containing phosphotransfer) domain-containing protein